MDGTVVAAAMLRARFYYADFLLQNFRTARSADIETILQPFGTASSSNPYVRLFSNADTPVAEAYRTEAAKLGVVSPEFKAYLARVGVRLP
jgi:hypothetical protein